MAKQIGPWIQKSTRQIYSNKWFSVREDEVVRPNGEDGIYGVLSTSHPSVYIVAVTQNEEIVIIQNFRYPIGRYAWEIPAGGSDGENLEMAARRELQEETGFVAQTWLQLGGLVVMNGLCDELMHVFLATGLTQTELHEQAVEGIVQVKTVSIDILFSMIQQGEFNDGQSMAALMLALQHIKK